MANYKSGLLFYNFSQPGLEFRFGGGNPPCDTGFDNSKKLIHLGIDPNFNTKNNTNKGITWEEFNYFSKELAFDPSCENFINMPSSINNVIFKIKKWDVVRGDEIKNQGIANLLSTQFNSLSIVNFFKKYYFIDFSKKITDNNKIINFNFGYDIIDDDVVNYINEIDNFGNSPELMDNLYKYLLEVNEGSKMLIKNSKVIYFSNKIYALQNSTKIIILFSVIMGGYLIYNVLKK